MKNASYCQNYNDRCARLIPLINSYLANINMSIWIKQGNGLFEDAVYFCVGDCDKSIHLSYSSLLSAIDNLFTVWCMANLNYCKDDNKVTKVCKTVLMLKSDSLDELEIKLDLLI